MSINESFYAVFLRKLPAQKIDKLRNDCICVSRLSHNVSVRYFPPTNVIFRNRPKGFKFNHDVVVAYAHVGDCASQ